MRLRSAPRAGILLVALAAGCTITVGKRSLTQHLQALVPADAVDCGTLRPSDGAGRERAVSQCLAVALRARRPFYFVRKDEDLASTRATGLVGRSDGRVVRFTYDSAPCHGPGCDERFETVPCPEATPERIATDLRCP